MHPKMYTDINQSYNDNQTAITKSFTPALVDPAIQERFEQLLIHYITQNNLPLRLVDSPSFQELITFANGKLKCPSRRKLGRLIEA